MSTLALAEKLGKVRVRKINKKNAALSSSEKSRQIFSHVIVIDFEATCWEDKNNRVPSEIIEFPAVLVRLADGHVVDVFHTYVMPTEEPILSDFCLQLTGITQKTLEEDGVPLPTAIMMFNKWLTRVKEEHNLVINDVKEGTGSCTFVTWSDWDLNVCLAYECKRKQIRKPVCFNAWCDLRKLYQEFYSRKPNGLNGALQDVGIKFDGREHSGIADARNTARLVQKLVSDGCVVMITKYTLGAELHAKLRHLQFKSMHFLTKTSPKLAPPPQPLTTPPPSTSHAPETSFRRTPPLCGCGRRAKSLTVQMPGPNKGRNFFACSKGRKSGENCKFFRWEDQGQSPILRDKENVGKTCRKSDSVQCPPTKIPKLRDQNVPEIKTTPNSGNCDKHLCGDIQSESHLTPKTVLSNSRNHSLNYTPPMQYFGNVSLNK